MRRLLPVTALAAALLLPLTVSAQPLPATPEAPAAKPGYDENTSFGILLGDPKAKAVLQENWPIIIEAVEMGGVPNTRTMKEALESDSARTKGGLTDEIYAKIIAGLKKL